MAAFLVYKLKKCIMRFKLILSIFFLNSLFASLKAQDGLPLEPIEPLRNPDRGLHVECNYFVHNYVNPFNRSDVYPDNFIDVRLERCQAKGDSLTLTQLYFYLSEYVNREIPEVAFDRMQVVFDDLKARGFKAILRFAYNYKGLNASGGETEEWVMKHLEQLRPFLRKNNGLIAACQVGFIGAWGEWHSSPLSKNQQTKNRLVNMLLDIFPKEYCLQLRYPKQKKMLTLDRPEDWKRIGFSNDYFTAGEHSHAPENDFVPGDDNYKMVLEDAAHFFMSGEIPYAENTEWGLHQLISVDRSLQILRDHHYSAFDITQNTELNIRHWRNYRLCPEKLDSLQIPYDAGYFKNSKGLSVSRSAYDFIRDHLGYRLHLVSSALKKETGKLVYSIVLKNTGFATVVNPHPVYLMLMDESGKIVSETKLSDVSPKDWQPYRMVDGRYGTIPYTIEGELPVSLKAGVYRVAFWMPDAQTSLRHHPMYDIKWVEGNGLCHWCAGKYVLNIVGTIKW